MNTYKGIFQILSRPGVTKFFLLLPIGLCLSLTSCDESSVVGLDVQPANDLLNVGWSDTTTLVTKTVEEDSLRTEQGIILNGTALIGKYYDPIFGMTSSSLYTEIRLPTSGPDFGQYPTMLPTDYVEMSLVYDAKYYGASTFLPQTMNVYQLNEELLSGHKYYDNNTVPRSTFDLAGSAVFTPNPTATTVVAGTTLKPQLKVFLNNNFGQTILNASAANLASSTAFETFTKGLYITTENTNFTVPGDGNIMHFLMNDVQTKITIHYHAWTIVKGVSVFSDLEYDLPLNSVGVRFSHFDHQFGGITGAYGPLQSQLGLQTPVPASEDTVAFVQSLDGVKTKIEMPYLKRWNDNGLISINKAELVVRVDTSALFQYSTYAPPANMVVFGINDDGTDYALPDAFEGSNYYGGSYNSSTKEYRFNIERYIQQVLNGKHSNNGLHLIATSGAVNANRAVIGGGKPSKFQMKLNITYTKIH